MGKVGNERRRRKGGRRETKTWRQTDRQTDRAREQAVERSREPERRRREGHLQNLGQG